MGVPGFTATISIYATERNWWSRFIACGGLGESCCESPYQDVAACGPLVSCDQGLGCDITTKKCVAPCGGPGQPCCDGPKTRALKWTADGKLYCPNSFDMEEMCNAGACDRQSHRCFNCGSTDGARCCPPDAAQATARCRGTDLECEFDPWGFYESGTCIQCGISGRKPCDWGCQPGLGIRNKLCAQCGDIMQPPCDTGCKSNLGTLNGLCRPCGNVGQVRCDNGCKGVLRLKNGLCAACGAIGQPPCDDGCNAGARNVNGICKQCGYSGQLPCDNGKVSPCVYPYKVAGGVCRYCGGTGQVPCDATGCGQGLVLINGVCVSPPPPGPDTCASIGNACVPNTQPGMHCCQSPGAPASCVWQKCEACIPHGQVIPLGAKQICCAYQDAPVIDAFTGNWICDIPDAPDKK
jgi:hypothetical protein